MRGNSTPFKNREFQKGNYVRGQIRSKYQVPQFADNKPAYKNSDIVWEK